MLLFWVEYMAASEMQFSTRRFHEHVLTNIFIGDNVFTSQNYCFKDSDSFYLIKLMLLWKIIMSIFNINTYKEICTMNRNVSTHSKFHNCSQKNPERLKHDSAKPAVNFKHDDCKQKGEEH